MTILELVERINAMWPFGGAESLASAVENYRAVLGQFEGDRLARCWKATLEDWKEKRRPLPAEVRAHMPSLTTRVEAQGEDLRDVFGRARELAGQLERQWHDNNRDFETQFLASFTAEDSPYAAGHLYRRSKIAHGSPHNSTPAAKAATSI